MTTATKTHWQIPGLVQPEAILDLHNTKTGRVFLLGSGPSLLEQTDVLAALGYEDTLGVHNLPLWDDLPFTPTYYAIHEKHQIEAIENYDWPGWDMKKFVIYWRPVRREGWQWVAKAPVDLNIFDVGFCGLDDELPPIPSGICIPLSACQLLAWMGYTEFYFLGCELTIKGECYDTDYERRVRGESWSRKAQGAFTVARREIERAGRTIVDCTPGGRLSENGILDYVPLEEVLAY